MEAGEIMDIITSIIIVILVILGLAGAAIILLIFQAIIGLLKLLLDVGGKRHEPGKTQKERPVAPGPDSDIQEEEDERR